ncbi:GNAT family N-acetyltransferase [Allomuricauda taeanensis]|uniref:GNAT family N-acetyltransferase n=1 Tax=Flagellimonas taeanensis TaxID=1005926 RepID=UPI002E7BB680|nr:GNAT family N-acetyltransferase [Allomuricauda taeanensis]MEE1963187.1 GNAT family N-acetyltransferase [Allomuricauda taeanensis]
MIQIIQNEKDWTATLQTIGNFDFYHTYEYHKVRLKDNEEPWLVSYTNGETKIALPFVKRPIIDTPFFDLTTVHGYLGPASKLSPEKFDLPDFKNEFDGLLQSENIVSAFSKLNPYIDHQEIILENMGSIEQVGELLYIDLTTDPVLQRQSYRKSVKNDVNKLRRNFTVRVAETEEDLHTFIDIYSETMDRVSADERFILGQDYFDTLTKSKNFEVKVLLVVCNSSGEVAAGSLSIITNGIIQGELMGTKNKFLPASPAKLLYDEIRLVGNELNQKYLNYGGGAGGREGSLYMMKSGFTKNHIPFKVWKYIVDPEKYRALASKKDNFENKNFFPLYRA